MKNTASADIAITCAVQHETSQNTSLTLLHVLLHELSPKRPARHKVQSFHVPVFSYKVRVCHAVSTMSISISQSPIIATLSSYQNTRCTWPDGRCDMQHSRIIKDYTRMIPFHIHVYMYLL